MQSESQAGRGTILVTGGAGYIGSHACKALTAAGYRPVAYDNLVYGHRWAVRWGPLEVGDIGDAGRLDQVFQRHRPSAVMHFAAFAYVGESVRDPARYYRNNVAGTLTLLEAMLRHRVARMVFSSTCATYGIPRSVPIREDTEQRPINPYGASKLMIERILQDFDRAYGLHHVALRYFNAAGADPDGEIGEDHVPETHLIPLAVRAGLGQGPRLQVYGTDYDTDDGTAVRDYIHVADLADAHVRALDYLAGGGASRAFNLGTGRGHSVAAVIAAVARALGGPVPVQHAPRRAGDPPVLVADAGAVGAALGWVPRLAELDAIIGTAVRWHRRPARVNTADATCSPR